MTPFKSEVEINSSTLDSALMLIDDISRELNINDSELMEYQVRGYKLLKLLKWIKSNQGILDLDIEKSLIKENPPDIRKRLIRDYLLMEKPIFLELLPRGRTSFLKRLSSSFQQCLQEAELFKDKNIYWWDELQSNAFSKQDKRKLFIGREAEIKSKNYEENRVCRPIDWVSLNENYLGYDLHSFTKRGENTRLTIEVKGSKQVFSSAAFYITKNEWNHASKTTGKHVFHVWDLLKMKLAILLVKDLEKHVPRNYGKGTWESVRMPFSLFKNKFKLIKLIMK